MIEQELLLLGLLKESPKHGYEIKIKIKEILFLFAGIELKSIYYPLTVLEKSGLIEKKITKPGKRPERIVYCLTLKGRKRFDELLAKSFLNFKRPQFSLDLSLYFLNYIKADVAKRRLRGRQLILKRLAKSIKSMVNSLKQSKPSPLLNILEHNLRMVETESKFLSDMMKSSSPIFQA
jgi:DNA-binding PadR family transcriptional regulator